MTVLIVVPVFDEAATVGAVVAAARAYGPVLVIDDGSRDGSAEIARRAGAEVIRHPRRRGKGEAILTGIAAARERGASAVVTLDGDGQHAPEDVPRLVCVARAHPDDLVIGARLVGREAAPRARRRANRVADFFIGWAAGQPLDDSQSGFRVYPASLLRRLDVGHGPSRGFVFESETLIAAGRLGVKCRSVAIAAVYPQNARPSHFRPVADIARISRMVMGQLLRRGLYPVGLYRSLARRTADDAVTADEAS
jgi:glycosyltransferase involved in cell wall biosynthesis